MTAKQLTAKMKGLPTFLPGALSRSIKALSETIVDMNVSQMEEMGEDSLGNKFGGYSAASYDMGYPQLKSALGREGRFVNLSNEGVFHGSMDVRVSGGGIEIYARDEKKKVDKLIERYGIDIFGLNDENMDDLLDEITDYLTDELRSYFT